MMGLTVAVADMVAVCDIGTGAGELMKNKRIRNDRGEKDDDFT
jgi:hypothetical protein